MKKGIPLLILILPIIFSGREADAAAGEKRTVKKVVKYRKHSVVDLSGTMIRGKIKSPEIFYIFQRKRVKGGHFVKVPENLDYHHLPTIKALGKVLSR